jgi:PKD repeat protein
LDTTHRFTDPGTYLVTFQATDGNGTSWSSVSLVSVANVSPLSVRVHASPANLTVGEWTNLSAIEWGGVAPYEVKWSFGDGASLNSSSNITSHTYLHPGLYLVSAALTDSGLGAASSKVSLTITYATLPFSVQIQAKRTAGPAHLLVNLTAAATAITLAANALSDLAIGVWSGSWTA